MGLVKVSGELVSLVVMVDGGVGPVVVFDEAEVCIEFTFVAPFVFEKFFLKCVHFVSKLMYVINELIGARRWAGVNVMVLSVITYLTVDLVCIIRSVVVVVAVPVVGGGFGGCKWVGVGVLNVGGCLCQVTDPLVDTFLHLLAPVDGFTDVNAELGEGRHCGGVDFGALVNFGERHETTATMVSGPGRWVTLELEK